MKDAKANYLFEEKALLEKSRELINDGAWFDQPSVVERLKERMEKRAEKLAKLQDYWEESKVAWYNEHINSVRQVAAQAMVHSRLRSKTLS